MDRRGNTAKLFRGSPRHALFVVAILAVLGYALWPSRHPTEEYWNRVHALTRDADAIKNVQALDEAIRVLHETENELAELNADGVDQLAIDAAIRFQGALAAARRCAEHVEWINDHPIRAGVSLVVGQSATETLRLRLLDLRQKSIQAYEFALTVHRQLTKKYPRCSFATPIPPDVQPIDEVILQLEAADEGLRWIFEAGVFLGALAHLLLGG